jgi:hypothetical protein
MQTVLTSSPRRGRGRPRIGHHRLSPTVGDGCHAFIKAVAERGGSSANAVARKILEFRVEYTAKLQKLIDDENDARSSEGYPKLEAGVLPDTLEMYECALLRERIYVTALQHMAIFAKTASADELREIASTALNRAWFSSPEVLRRNVGTLMKGTPYEFLPEPWKVFNWLTPSECPPMSDIDRELFEQPRG